MYVVPGTALRSDTHRAPPAPARPVRAPPSASTTFTEAIVPPVAVTVTGRPAAGSTTFTFAGGVFEAGAPSSEGPLAACAVQAVRETLSATAARTGRGARIRSTEDLRKGEERVGCFGL
ncbi:hypothetical protein GCM10018791_00780 [Streptomyces zaomyceticus]|nr:hypothetical protein GCM10018791_00780 [Streptomyces zaomyceticus]